MIGRKPSVRGCELRVYENTNILIFQGKPFYRFSSSSRTEGAVRPDSLQPRKKVLFSYFLRFLSSLTAVFVENRDVVAEVTSSSSVAAVFQADH